MQHHQHYTYPQIFWTDNSANCCSDYALPGLSPNEIVSPQDICPPLPVPARKQHRQNTRDGTCLCFLVVFLLTLLALTGVGLIMFQIFHLQQELDTLKEVTASAYLGTEMPGPFPHLGKKVASAIEGCLD